MAYVLGFMYADGNITDSVVFRTQYISFDSADREIIEKIKIALSSNHKIQIKPERLTIHANGTYKSREAFRLRIGSREMFDDLLRPHPLITCAFSSNLRTIRVPKNSMRSFTTPPIFWDASGTHLGETASSY